VRCAELFATCSAVLAASTAEIRVKPNPVTHRQARHFGADVCDETGRLISQSPRQHRVPPAVPLLENPGRQAGGLDLDYSVPATRRRALNFFKLKNVLAFVCACGPHRRAVPFELTACPPSLSIVSWSSGPAGAQACPATSV
jgi:hypothetical protein